MGDANRGTMNILVINCGSSSIKLDVLNPQGDRLFFAHLDRVGHGPTVLTLEDEPALELGDVNHEDALKIALPKLLAVSPAIGAVGHRVVHGGRDFDRSVRIDRSVEDRIEALIPLAPLHNGANLAGIRGAKSILGDVPHVAVFDTAFHRTMPRRAKLYALSAPVVEKHAIERYGFHGPSHAWVSRLAADWLGEDLRSLRLITCHLGNGASVCAVEFGRSVETSMGMTPLEGLVMGTRSGDVDPGVLIEIMRREKLDVEELDTLLNRASGLKGVSGVGNDMRDIEEKAAAGHEGCRLAIQVFAHRVRKYIGAYAATMGGVDAIIFTAGIGENSALIRHRVSQRLDFLGAILDEDRNRDAQVTHGNPVSEISRARARTKLLVVRTDEARFIAESTAKIASEQDRVRTPATIPIAISARHIHLTQDAVEVLFGEGHTLTPYKDLSQPGQFASEEKCTIVGPRNRIENVRVLGPTRPACQIEISRTDEFTLGIDAPVRDSGDVKNSAPVTLIGPAGQLALKEGLICARRHIHMTPDDAERFGVKHKDVVDVAIDSDGRDLIFGDVLVRVKSSYRLEMHLDTDEANAADIRSGHEGTLAPTDVSALIKRRRTEYDQRRP